MRPVDQCALDSTTQRDRRFVTNSLTNGSPVPRLIWVKQVDVERLYEACILILSIPSPPKRAKQYALDWTTQRGEGLSQTVPPMGHQSHASYGSNRWMQWDFMAHVLYLEYFTSNPPVPACSQLNDTPEGKVCHKQSYGSLVLKYC